MRVTTIRRRILDMSVHHNGWLESQLSEKMGKCRGYLNGTCAGEEMVPARTWCRIVQAPPAVENCTPGRPPLQTTYSEPQAGCILYRGSQHRRIFVGGQQVKHISSWGIQPRHRFGQAGRAKRRNWPGLLPRRILWACSLGGNSPDTRLPPRRLRAGQPIQ